jgi:hypothetical protein
LNPNYDTIIKQDINKLFAAGFIKLVKEAKRLFVNSGCSQEEWEVENLC